MINPDSITVDRIIRINQLLTEHFKEPFNVINKNGIESALSRIERYDSPQEKAAALLQSLFTNHPFINGNKRTIMVLLILILGREPRLHYGKWKNVNNFDIGEIAPQLESHIKLLDLLK